MMKQYRGQRGAPMGSSYPNSYKGQNCESSALPCAMTAGQNSGMNAGGNNGMSGGNVGGAGNTSANPMGCVSAGSYKGFPLAIVFPPAQSYGNLYSPMDGLANGTLFADLKMPFHGNFKI